MITNNSYLDSRAFDGFRRCIEKEFKFAYFIDLGGDIRKLSGKDGIWLNENNTIFGISAAVGISIAFLIKGKKENDEKCIIRYIHPTDIRATRDEKIAYLQEHKFKDIPFEIVRPDKTANWINLSDNDFDTLLPLIDKEVKGGNGREAIFKLFWGIATQRDEWVYDFLKGNLGAKMEYFTEVYEKTRLNPNEIVKHTIKWDRELDTYRNRKIEKEFESEKIVNAIYRPFVKQYFYFDKHFNGMTYQWLNIYKPHVNKIIGIPGLSSPKDFHCLGFDTIIDLNALPAGCQCVPLYRYDSEGNQIENITDWALQQFISHYTAPNITKEDIFHYVYAVLHNPKYRQKYELNLKREFPRIPFYTDFEKWVAWGKTLIDLHINYENAAPYPLTEKTKEKENPKAKLKAIKENGEIVIDESTSLMGVPLEAYNYKLGNRSAIEWVLDQYKESKPTDPTIREKFNTYKFADYKTHVIDLLKRVCTVSMETVRIVEEMAKG